MNRDELSRLPALASLEPRTRNAVIQSASILTAPADAVVFSPGSECTSFIFVLEGSVRVSITSRSGREVVLYRVEGGQTCVLTTSCLMGGGTYEAEGRTETAVKALALPASCFSRLLEESASFRKFAFTTFASRLHDLIVLINEIAFGQLDHRLAAWLSSNSSGNTITATHQDIATELGATRETVSRLLKEFERKGWLKLERGQITVLQTRALSHYTAKQV